MSDPRTLIQHIRDLRPGQKMTLFPLPGGGWQGNVCLRGSGWVCETRDTPEGALLAAFDTANHGITWRAWESPTGGKTPTTQSRPADYAEEFI